MRVPFLALEKELAREPVVAAIRRQLESGWYVGGPCVERFESRFAELCGVRFAVGVNSGTDALFLILKALGIGAGDEVITVSNSFVATAGAIVAAGARPVFVDVGADLQLDPALLPAARTARTRAVVPVHLTGRPADLPRIAAWAEQAGVALVEDAAQAVGAGIAGRRVGSFGAAAAFSLHPLKNLNVAGDGGVITTDDPEIHARLLRLRNHGLVDRNEALEFGYNSRLDSVQAAVGEVVLDRLPEITRVRREHAARYDALLSGLAPQLLIPPRDPKLRCAFHTYVVQCERRDELAGFLADHGIETKVHYPVPIHLMRAGRALGYRRGDLPVCEQQADRVLSLPVHQHLEIEQIEFVADRVRSFYLAEAPRAPRPGVLEVATE